MKRLGIMTLCILLAVSSFNMSCVFADLTEGEQAAIEHLSQRLADSAAALIGEDDDDQYSESVEQRQLFSDAFPEKFDLREYGVVPPVRFQNPWGTC